MAAAATAAFFLTLFLSIASLVLSFPFQAAADSPQDATDFLNYAPPVMQPPADDQSITGLLPESPIAPTVGVPVESGKEPSENVAAPTVGVPVESGKEPSENVAAPTVGVPVEGGDESSENVTAPTVGAPIEGEEEPSEGEKEPSDTDAAPTIGAPVTGGNEPSETVATPMVHAPIRGGNEPSATVNAPTIGAPTVGAAPVDGGNEPTEGSEGSSVNGGVEEQEPSDHGSLGLLAPSASPIPSTPAAAAPVGGLNGPFGQRQQPLEGSVNGEEHDLGAQPLVDNTPFDSGSTKMGYFSLFGYAGVVIVAFIGLLV